MSESLTGTETAQSPGSQTTSRPTFIVGVGASAGGLEALGKLLGALPAGGSLAFVIVQHLSPDHKSFMVELLSKRTAVHVRRAEDGQVVEANNVYLIPPKTHLKIFQGRLYLVEPRHERGINLPIDVFFRSLAEDQKQRAVGIVLSGTGSDGTLGIRAIKDAGGLVMVQSEDTAQFDGMPRSAIGTGLADFILPPEEMPGQLLRYVQHPFVAREQGLSRDQSSTEMLMQKIFAVMLERCGVDFSGYKPTTIDRRIERRMTINQITSLGDYYAYLEGSPREAELLFNDLLICVTHFFRDREAFDFFQNSVLPGLFERTAADRSIRVWVPSCSTGEEAYSLAMLFAEGIEHLGKHWDVKVFATDISKEAIQTASYGLYSESVVADVPSDLLAKYFVKKPEGYQVQSALRRMVVFARHDLVKDPPFTKLDLVSCRNVLIYFQPALQTRVIGLLHFALKEDAILFLGNSETVGELAELFQPLSTRHRIYQNRPGSRMAHLQFQMQPSQSARGTQAGASAPRASRPAGDIALVEAIYKEAVAEYVPACIVVDDNREVLHLMGKAGDYLRAPDGVFTNNVLKLTAHNLSAAIATALHKAGQEGGQFTYENVKFKDGELVRTVRLRVKTLNTSPRSGAFKLLFIEEQGEALPSSARGEEFQLDRIATQRVGALEQELTYTKESLQATIEELEAANEELQATNEELLASNEELQSTNEELQSVNEELHTVNAENQNRITELAELTNDINNLFASSHVGTLLVDKELRIRRVSNAIYALTSLSSSDIGAPLEVLSRALRFHPLIAMAERVLARDKAEECDVAGDSGKKLLLRVAPYRTETGVARGLVVALIDIGDLNCEMAATCALRPRSQPEGEPEGHP